MAKLHIVRSEKHAGEVYEVGDVPTLIGCHMAAQVPLKDPWVSFEHATITSDEGKFWLTDKESASGTWLNKQRLAPLVRVILNDGDVIHLGKTKVRFYVKEVPQAAEKGGKPETSAGTASPPGEDDTLPVVGGDTRKSKVDKTVISSVPNVEKTVVGLVAPSSMDKAFRAASAPPGAPPGPVPAAAAATPTPDMTRYINDLSMLRVDVDQLTREVKALTDVVGTLRREIIELKLAAKS